ncbi:MAG: SGNH/GDSL hydrolase family protein, partial [Myxococcales bacterium]|nr:SGNH/GDSL hydrolase family protein [Myxococcales bacterium]
GMDMLPVGDPTAAGGAAGMGAAPDAPATSDDPAGEPDTGDDTTPSGPDAPADPADDPAADLGMGDGSDVIAIGDSWMNLGTVGIQQSLAAASGQPYRAYGVPGTRLLDEAIPGQYAAARAENPDIKTVVVTGGGNDILQNPLLLLDCPALGQSCMDTMDMIGLRYEELAAELAADGVEDIIIVNYSRGTALGPAPVEYAWEALAPFCEQSSPVDCHLVDPDEVAGGTMPLRDGIHPTDAGYDMLGEHIYDLMVDGGMRR